MMRSLREFDGRRHPNTYTDADELERIVVTDAVQGLDLHPVAAEPVIWWAFGAYQAIAKIRYGSNRGPALDRTFEAISAKVTEVTGRPWPVS